MAGSDGRQYIDLDGAVALIKEACAQQFAKIRESGRDIGRTQGVFIGTEEGRRAAADELKYIINKALEDYKSSLSRP
jgi:DNA invertase Pin-like site-specific DNA recombinase